MSHWAISTGVWEVLACLLVAAVAARLSLLNWRRSGKRRAIAGLETLRLMLVALLLLTLLRPESVRSVKKDRQPEVAVLLDDSGSMETRDVTSGPKEVISRQEWIREKTNAPAWDRIRKTASVAFENFSTPTTATNSISPGTDLATPLEEALQPQRNLKAVVVLTDGDWNNGNSPLGAATRLRQEGVPIFPVVVGRDRPLPDVALEIGNPPSYGLVGEQVTLPFKIRNTLGHSLQTSIILSQSGRELTRRPITVAPNAEVTESLLWLPEIVGTSTLSLSVPVDEQEVLTNNNTGTLTINIRQESLKVLLVDSYPRWEYRYLRNALARDPGVEMSSILFHPELGPGGGRNYLTAFPDTKEAIGKYDVIFLGDVGIGRGELTKEQATLIKGLVEQQAAGLVFIPGRRGRQISFDQSDLGELMPVILDSSRPEGIPLQNEATLTLSSMGMRHLLTRFDIDQTRNENLWQQLPGFFWSAAVTRSRPGSDVLAVHSGLRGESGRMPLLVTKSAGAGKVLFLGTDSAWRWRRGVEDKYHYRFWSQVVRWMSHQRHLAGEEGIRLAYTPETPRPGDVIHFQASVLTQAGLPVEEGPIDIRIQNPAGQTETATMESSPGGWGVFGYSQAFANAGQYRITVESAKHARKLEAKIEVKEPERERRGQPVNRQILDEIASLTGGKVYTTDTFDQLTAHLALLPEPEPAQIRLQLWSHPLWGGLILFLLTAYWLGRKWAGLV